MKTIQKFLKVLAGSAAFAAIALATMTAPPPNEVATNTASTQQAIAAQTEVKANHYITSQMGTIDAALIEQAYTKQSDEALATLGEDIEITGAKTVAAVSIDIEEVTFDLATTGIGVPNLDIVTIYGDATSTPFAVSS